MNARRSLEIGFDPAFLDVIAKLQEPDGSSARMLPKPGQHHPWASIQIIPGGNGFNFARALFLHGYNVRYWSKIDPIYETILKKEEPHMRFASVCEVPESSNITIALEMEVGEIQINDARHGIHPDELSDRAMQAFKHSEVNTYLNLGLNPHSLKLYEKLAGSVRDNSRRVSIFDPSTLRDFSQWNSLRSWFEEYYSVLPGKKIISLNREESEIFFANFSKQEVIGWVDYVVTHSSKTVEIKSKDENINVNVPSLSPPYATFVGIGDAFNAGLTIGLADGLLIRNAVKQAIQWAQNLLRYGWKSSTFRNHESHQ